MSELDRTVAWVDLLTSRGVVAAAFLLTGACVTFFLLTGMDLLPARLGTRVLHALDRASCVCLALWGPAFVIYVTFILFMLGLRLDR